MSYSQWSEYYLDVGRGESSSVRVGMSSCVDSFSQGAITFCDLGKYVRGSAFVHVTRSFAP